MKTAGPYTLTDDGAYVVTDFNRAKPFSSFLPGVAGLWGVPMWAYYVNRGQALACFGTRDKDHAIMEFQSAKLHEHRTALEGFRTFVRWQRGDATGFYEPFRTSNPDYDVSNELRCLPHALELHETNTTIGLVISVTFFTLPDEPFAALMRRVTIENVGNEPLTLEVLDGAARIAAYGVPAILLKKMPFIMESYLQVEGLESGTPFIKIKAQESDSSETAAVESGNFFLGFLGGSTESCLPAVVDPERVFGDYADLVLPYAFLAEAPFDATAPQNRHCQTCCAFLHAGSRALAPGQRIALESCYGTASSMTQLDGIRHTVAAEGFFDRKLDACSEVVASVMDRFTIVSALTELDQYARQTFLDNTLRGGLPVPIRTAAGPAVLHVYSRKHGDLERDYNAFELEDGYLSQGNGNFRDVNQNRRCDVWFEPAVAAENVRQFFNLLQPDGFNPLVCRGLRFQVADPAALEASVKPLAGELWDELRRATVAPFSPGALFMRLEATGRLAADVREPLLAGLLGCCEKLEEAEYGAGYWTDHWLYNIDQLRQFRALYPDRFRELMLDDAALTYWDPDVRVLPRDERYVLMNDRVWHIDSIAADAEKSRLIAGRSHHARCVRTEAGRGVVYRTSLLGKMVCLFVSKMASISPSGIGVDMEAGKPGWHDSINGIPGALGASTSEIYHLLSAVRMVRAFVEEQVRSGGLNLAVPTELVDLLREVVGALAEVAAQEHAPAACFRYWDRTATAKERYRDRVRFGFQGADVTLGALELMAFLDACERRLSRCAEDAMDPRYGLPSTYVTHDVLAYEVVTDPATGTTKRHARGCPCVRILEVRPHRLPIFLEAPTHLLCTGPGGDEARRIWRAVRQSPLFDRELGMYIVGDSVREEGQEVGRIWAWPPGWFENENVFLHLEHKYLLALLRAGATGEFFEDFRNCLLPFQDLERYGRNPLENASFIVSSRHPRPDYRGRGFLPRSSGTTAEVIEMLLLMCFGPAPFRVEEGRLVLRLEPVLPEWIYTRAERPVSFIDANGSARTERIRANGFAALFLSHTLVVYRSHDRRPTFGEGAARVQCCEMILDDGSAVTSDGPVITAPYAEAVRSRQVARINVELG